jgi:hypothetical protein
MPTCLRADETLFARLQDRKDWIIGLVVGVLGGWLAVLLLSFRVPHLRINRSIVNRKGHAGQVRPTIQGLNRRKFWWFVTGDAIDIRAELHVVTYSDRGRETTRSIGLVRANPLVIPHRKRFGRLPGLSEYIFDIKRSCEELKWWDRVCRYVRGESFQWIINGDYRRPGDWRIRVCRN